MAAFGISALWHGIYTGYYISLCSVPFYLAVEDIYDKQYRNYADSAGVSNFFNCCLKYLSAISIHNCYNFFIVLKLNLNKKLTKIIFAILVHFLSK